MSEAFNNLPTGTRIEVEISGAVQICRIICKDEQYDLEPHQKVDLNSETRPRLVPGYFVAMPDGSFSGIRVQSIKRVVVPDT